jgi:hypothetical protein
MIDGMRISVWVERAEPLVGHASRETQEELLGRGDGPGHGLRFEGWLGLLRVLSELLLPERHSRP